MTMKNTFIDPLLMRNAKVKEQIDLLSVGDILSIYRLRNVSPLGVMGEYNEVTRSIILDVEEDMVYLSVMYTDSPEKTSENIYLGKMMFFRYPWRVQNAV